MDAGFFSKSGSIIKHLVVRYWYKNADLPYLINGLWLSKLFTSPAFYALFRDFWICCQFRIVHCVADPYYFRSGSWRNSLLTRIWILYKFFLFPCFLNQNQGCGSVSAWIIIHFPSWIRIRIQYADPDPGVENLKKEKKCKANGRKVLFYCKILTKCGQTPLFTTF